MATTCTPANLITEGRKVAPLSQRQKKALLIYGLAKLLSALGGTNYWSNFPTLISASKSWQPMNQKQQEAAVIELIFDLAVSHGASISSDINALLSAVKIPQAATDQDTQITFLSCAVRNVL